MGYPIVLVRAEQLALVVTLLAGLIEIIFSSSAFADTLAPLRRNALAFDRYFLTSPAKISAIQGGANASGLGGADGWGVTGWFDYDFKVAAAGWYQVLATVSGSYKSIEYIIDPELYSKGTGGFRLYSTGRGFDGKVDRVGAIWIEPGGHTLRVRQMYWTGFPPITDIAIVPSASRVGERTRAALSASSTIFRKNQCASLDITWGQLKNASNLKIWIKDETGAVRDQYVVPLAGSDQLLKQARPLYCSAEGTYTINFGDDSDRPYSQRDLASLKYEVIDTDVPARPPGDLRKTLIQEIDCSSMPPDFSEGGTHVVQVPFGTYRESGVTDWKRYQQLSPASRILLPKPSWFAYKLRVPPSTQPYLIEIDYPDDKFRSFAIALLEDKPLGYPVAGGVDSGGEFSLSHATATQTLIYWPRKTEVRLVFMNARAGSSAAATRIRVYRIDNAFPVLREPLEGGRYFANWYEEGSNFASLYGSDQSPAGSRVAVERWAQSFSYMGGNVLFPAVNVYNFVLYPSSYNLAFSAPVENDVLRRMLLVSEKYGMKLVPDLHPRADELAWPYNAYPSPKPNLLVSKNGKAHEGTPPHYNPLFPANQDWYVNMIGEVVDKYKDSSALLGVSLRLMQWQNPALNNFQSLDWGYDDFTTALFKKETGIAMPAFSIGADRFRHRYEWLMANARTDWITWRSKKIAQLFTRIRDRVRQARPDLKVYAVAFDAYPSGFGTSWLQDAGVDAQMLSKIDGVVMINALHAYGRLYDPITTQGTRDNLVDPSVLRSLVGPGENGAFLSYSRYFEAKDIVVPQEAIGFSPGTRKTWTSAVVNPSGRHYLERYALALAETDAAWLGDGGNGFSLGQPLLREFLLEYRALPAVPFVLRQDARDPVAVWELTRPGDRLFYAVNRERTPMTVHFTMQGTGGVYRLSSGQRVALNSNVFSIQLLPFQLMAFKTSGGLRLASVATDITDAVMKRVSDQVAWIETLNNNAQGGKAGNPLSLAQKKRLAMLAAEAKAALSRRWVWRARTIMENHELLPLYGRGTNQTPPALREMEDSDR